MSVAIIKKRSPLFIMGLFIFLMSIGEGMTAPAIPLYGDTLGSSYKQLGFLMTGYSVAYAAMTLFAGRISDQIGRKKLLLFSLILSIIASTGYFFSTTPFMLLAFRTLEGMSRGILWPVAEAIVADNTTFQGRGRAMGNFTAAYGGGVAIGTLLGGYMMQYVSLTSVFPYYPVLGVVVFILILTKIQDSSHRVGTHGVSGVDNPVNLMKEIKKIWPVCYVGFAYAGFLYSTWGLLSKVADSFAVSYLGIGVIFTLFWLSRLSSFMVSGKAIDTYGRKKVYLTGLVLCAASAGGFLFAGNLTLFLLVAVLGGVGTGIVFPLSMILIADYGSPELRGFGMGMLELIMGLGMISQTAISGILGETFGVHMTFFFTFCVILLAIPITVRYIHEPKGETE